MKGKLEIEEAGKCVNRKRNDELLMSLTFVASRNLSRGWEKNFNLIKFKFKFLVVFGLTEPHNYINTRHC